MSDYYRNLSLILSRVMDDIGVSEEIVMMRRRAHLIQENSDTLGHTLKQDNITTHIFGSQTEGTTTPGLQSDIDELQVLEDYNVIHDWKDWEPGKVNLLMIQDDVFRPGYCKLQLLRDDMPLAMDVVLDEENYMYDENRRILMKSKPFSFHMDGIISHGPTMQVIEPGAEPVDLILAFPSQNLTHQYKEWSSRQRPLNWPTLEMIEYMGNTRCFVVPYVHLVEDIPNTDWRISTSLAERFLMFSLNITHIRCYVLLKMIVKTFIEPHVPDVISSYICKTLLFHCLDRTRRDFWIEPNLVQCVNHVLLYMLAAVHTIDCPNYFNDASNLLFGKIDDDIQEQLMTKIREVVRSDGRFLVKIRFDDLNSRLTRYITDRNLMLSFDENEKEKAEICGQHTPVICCRVIRTHLSNLLDIERKNIPRDRILPTTMDFIRNGGLQRRAGMLCLPFICSYLATCDASECILQGQDISPRTKQLYRLSLGSDASSSRLKYASFLYCTGQYQDALSFLHDLERRLTPAMVHVCACTMYNGYHTDAFEKEVRHNPYPSTSDLAFCVMFTRAEIQCCPREMRFEFNRSTEEDKLHRKKYFDYWMDLAVLDCLPYLYYLQYMTARHLGQQDQQYRALQNLESHVGSEESLGHRETAYNILGQCLELENNIDRALMYYRMSLQVRPRNNAARLLLSRHAWGLIFKREKLIEKVHY